MYAAIWADIVPPLDELSERDGFLGELTNRKRWPKSIDTSSLKMMFIREPSRSAPSIIGLLSEAGRPIRSDIERR